MAVAFQLGIGSTSPTITYHPFSPNVIAQDATSGWTTYFTNSGFPSTPGQAGDGTGLQISSENGSFFSITWFGIGIDLYGNATLAAFEVSLDRKNGGSGSGDVMVGPSSNLLASFSNLPLDTYTVTLTANTSSSPSSFIAFERAVITSAVEVANLNDLTVQSVTVDNAMIVYEGLWSTFQSTVIAPESQFHVTDQLGDTAQLTFNGTAVSVFGLRDTIAGTYNVTLDGETTQYTAQSIWEEGAVLFYTTGLDPGRTHSLIITNAENSFLAIGYINTTSVSGMPISPSAAGISKGAIAGIVIGIFLGVVVFPIIGFTLWRRRRRGNKRDFTFIEPSIHKGYDITEVLDIHPGSPDQRRKPSQSPVSEVSLELFSVSTPQSTRPWSRASPPTFPRSPTTSLPSPTKENSGDGIVHLPEVLYQHLSARIQSPQTVDSGNAPSPGVNRRSSVPKPSGPRPQSHRTSTCDPRPSLLISPMQAVPEPSSLNCQAPTEPDLQPVNEEGGTMTYSFLDMNATSRPPSLMDGPGKPPNPTQPLPHTNHDSLRLLPIIRTSPTPSNRDSDRRPEIRNSKRVSLSAVIRQLPIPKLRLSAELHPHSPGRPQTSRSSRSLRPQTGGASPTESVPMTTSEVSEIRFCSPGEGSESNASQRSARDTPSPSLKVTTMTSPIYQKLFGTQQGEVPPDGVLGKKRPLRRKQLSASAFDIPPRT